MGDQIGESGLEAACLRLKNYNAPGREHRDIHGQVRMSNKQNNIESFR
jgi:hypothetical protein